jgi:pyrroline-5-carboxylate reductase
MPQEHLQEHPPIPDNPPQTSTLPNVGILGVGTIAEALTLGLCSFQDRRATIILSPRNQETSSRLARRFPEVTVASHNQAVLDASDIVILAVRPQVAQAVLAPLHFRPGHQILSLIATFSLQQLSPLVAPARAISRAVPLPPVADRQGPLAVYTKSAEILRLLNGLGRLIPLEHEADLDLTSAVTSLMGTYFGMMGAVDRWLMEKGFAPESSRTLVDELFFNLAAAARKRPEDSFPTLSADYSTSGGLNEHAWRELQAAGWPNQIQAALDLILDRIHGRATFETPLRSSLPRFRKDVSGNAVEQPRES